GDRIRVGTVLVQYRRDRGARPALRADVPTVEAARAVAAEVQRAEAVLAGPRIVVLRGPDQGKYLRLLPGRRYVVGRGSDADLVLQDGLASRKHVDVELRDREAVLVRDLGSQNGARLAGQVIAPHAAMAWPLDAELAFGGNVFRFEHPATEPTR